MIEKLYKIILDRKSHPKIGSYTNRLFDRGLTHVVQKVGEEGTEVVVAALAQEDNRLIEEISDLVYHVLVLMVLRGITLEEISNELARRYK